MMRPTRPAAGALAPTGLVEAVLHRLCRPDGVPRLGLDLVHGKSDTRQPVSWLAGHHAMRAFPDKSGSSGCGRLSPTTMRIALAAHSCRDSLRFGRTAFLTAFP